MIQYKGKGNHSVNELESIIELQAEELHLYRSGQKNNSGIDLIELENRLSEVLDKETSESLTDWLKSKRNNL